MILRDWSPKFATGHRSKSIWVTILSFCYSDLPISESYAFWPMPILTFQPSRKFHAWLAKNKKLKIEGASCHLSQSETINSWSFWCHVFRYEKNVCTIIYEFNFLAFLMHEIKYHICDSKKLFFSFKVVFA